MECFLRVGSRNALNFFSYRIPSTGTNLRCFAAPAAKPAT